MRPTQRPHHRKYALVNGVTLMGSGIWCWWNILVPTHFSAAGSMVSREHVAYDCR
jgi:hypothetical protein